MMEATQDGLRSNLMTGRKSMSAKRHRPVAEPRIRNARAEASMGPAAVIVSNPFFENRKQMPFAERDQEIEALPPHGADEPLAESIRLRCPEWRLQYPQTHRFQARIEIRRVNAIAIMNEEVLCLFASHYLSELLKCPLRRGMRGHVEMGYPAGPYLQDDKDVEQAKTGSNAHEEVASQNTVSMVPDKGHPTL